MIINRARYILYLYDSLGYEKSVKRLRRLEREYQAKLIKEFDEKFGRPYEFVRCVQNEENFGVHRVSRFERI